jgi:hypothetical protein
MVAHVGHPKRARVADQHAEEAVASGQVADRAVGVRVDPAREEALELLAALVEDAQRGVARAGELTGDLEHAVEDDFEVELGYQGAPDVEETAQTLRVKIFVGHGGGPTVNHIPPGVASR